MNLRELLYNMCLELTGALRPNWSPTFECK